MGSFFPNRWLAAAFALVLFGWGPLLAILALAAVGLWPDQNPNPIGPGLLFFVSFWPAVISLGVGASKLRRQRA